MFVAGSYSKSLSLYGERIGAFSIVTQDANEAARVLSQVKRVIRTNYSSPPTHGGQAVAIAPARMATSSASVIAGVCPTASR